MTVYSKDVLSESSTRCNMLTVKNEKVLTNVTHKLKVSFHLSWELRE